MKLWKVFLIAISAAILPFALVGVGQAQQMTCWGLRPSQTEDKHQVKYPAKHSRQDSEDAWEPVDSSRDCVENEDRTNKGCG